jgi:hypothetical protein
MLLPYTSAYNKENIKLENMQFIYRECSPYVHIQQLEGLRVPNLTKRVSRNINRLHKNSSGDYMKLSQSSDRERTLLYLKERRKVKAEFFKSTLFSFKYAAIVLN